MTPALWLPVAVSLLSGVAIPMVTDLVTHWSAPDAMKAWIAAVLSALAGALSIATWDPSAGWPGYIAAVGAAFAVAFSAHHAGVSKPIKRATGSVGFGKRP
ncbi:MAG: hypothetical protein ACRDQA_17675 [Nocardioidaceae bacterium]